MVVMRLKEKLAHLQELSGLKGTEIARRSGVPASRWSEWKDAEKNRQPSLYQASAVAKVFSAALGIPVPLDYLADDAADEPPPPPFTEDERRVVELMRALRLDRDTALRRLAFDVDARGIEALPGKGRREQPKPSRARRSG